MRPEGAAATADPPATEMVGQVVRYVIYGDTGEVTIPIEDGGVTVLTFPDIVTTAYRVGNPKENSPIGIRQGERDVTLWTQKRGAVGARARAVFGIEGLVINATIRVTSDPQASVRSASFVKRTPPPEAPEPPERGAGRDESGDPARPAPGVDYLALAKNQLMGNSRLIPIMRREPRQDGPFRAELGDAVILDGRLYASFELINPGPNSIVLNEVRVRDMGGYVRVADTVSLDPPAVPASGSIAVIPPGTRSTGVLLVPETRYGGIGPEALMFEAAAGLGTVVASVNEWVFVPRRDREAQGRRELHAVANVGATWLPANVRLATGFKLDETQATTFTSFGLRYSYFPATFWWFSVETEMTYASTGEARFEDVTLDTGMQGDLVRRARLGRWHGGMLLRMGGDRYNPTLRAGLGLQIASYNAQIAGMEAPGGGFDFSAVWYVGPGMIMAIGQRCSLGLAASFIGGIKSLEQYVGLGLDFGCWWKPVGFNPYLR